MRDRDIDDTSQGTESKSTRGEGANKIDELAKNEIKRQVERMD